MDLLRIVVKKRSEGSKTKSEDRDSLSRFASRVAKLRGEGPMATSAEPEVCLEVVSINICDIEIPANYSRKTVGEVDSLVSSIKAYGIQQPLKVIKIKGTNKFRLVFGRRRLKAAEVAGLDAVPCIVELLTREDRLMMLAMAENIQRRELNPIEKGIGFHEMQEKTTLASEEMAKNLGIPLEEVTDSLELMNLPEAVRMEVIDNPGLFSLAMLKALLRAFKKSKASGKNLFKAMLSGSITNAAEAESYIATN